MVLNCFLKCSVCISSGTVNVKSSKGIICDVTVVSTRVGRKSGCHYSCNSFPLGAVPQTRQRMKLIDSLSLCYSIMRLSCNRPKSSKTAGVQVFVTLSKSTPHMRPQATKSSGNTPNTTSFMEKIFRALCFMLTSSLEKS